MIKSRLLPVLVTASVGLAALVASAQTAAPGLFGATLSGANERPNPVTTAAAGSATAVLEGNRLTVGGSFTGLSGPATGAHIHGPAGKDAAAGVLFPLAVSSAAAGNVGGGATLTDAQVQLLRDGMMYVNIHTAANPPGEIRGQLELKGATSAAPAGGTAAAGAGAAAATTAGTTAVAACPETIMIQNYAFVPARCSVAAGTTVKFMNMDAVGHTATSAAGAPAAFDTGLIARNATASVKLDRAGSYAYFCKPHPYMKGTIVVQ